MLQKRLETILFPVGLLFAFLIFSAPLGVFAETASEMNRQIQKEKRALKKIESEISKNRKSGLAAKKKERSLLTEMEAMDRRLTLLKREASLLELDIQKKEGEAKTISVRIKAVSSDIETGRKIILARIKSIYKEKQGAAFKILFAAQDYPDLLRKIQYLKIVAQKEDETLTQFKARQVELEEKKSLLVEVTERMVADREALALKLSQSRKERKKKDRFLARVRKERTFFKRVIVEMGESSKKVQGLILTLEKKKKALRVAIPGRFSAARGKLRWPNDGKLVSRFGRQKHPRFNEMIYRKGIEITPGQGGEVRSIFGGEIVYADWFRGYGMMVMIDHGENYYSLYAHLAQLLVGVGDEVKKDHIVGEVGGTGLSDGSNLYFEIRHQGKPTNPVSWLQKRP
ncbi:MAG: peptidoglycan DD-metalloendopeptidase family protein [Nitrospirae bacterium]|nr:peptidoglycan DD-metalloendopeptidase family protein [Candidatus Manganitrophaceae bacterium]